MRFPEVAGSNLQGQKYHLPGDFAGEFNIVLIAFKQHQQFDVNTWLPLLKRLRRQFPALHYYELPTIWELPKVRQMMIDMGMRMGIPDRHTRQTTITLYLDKDAFREALEIPHEDAITILLVDQAGRVLWRAMGAYNEAKGAALEASVQQLPIRAL